jgi:hypothetical protein
MASITSRSRSATILAAAVAALICLAPVACSSFRTGESWIGHTQAELVQALGSTNEWWADGSGGRYLVYRLGTVDGVPQGARQNVDTYHVNADGIVDAFHSYLYPAVPLQGS